MKQNCKYSSRAPRIKQEETEVLGVMLMKIQVFWDVISCCKVNVPLKCHTPITHRRSVGSQNGDHNVVSLYLCKGMINKWNRHTASQLAT